MVDKELSRTSLELADVVRAYGASFQVRYGRALSTEQGRVLRAIVA
jgi:hypothetical protein